MLTMRGSRGGTGGPTTPPGKSQVTIGFLEILVRNPLEKELLLEGGSYGPL